MEDQTATLTNLADVGTIKWNDDRWVTFKINGIKVEMQTRRTGTKLIIGYGCCLEDRLAIRDGIKGAQLQGMNGGPVFVQFKTEEECFTTLLEVIEYINTNNIKRTAPYKPFNGNNREHAIRTIIERLRLGITFRPDLGFESVHFTCGQSDNITKKSVYREHAVPVWTLLQLIEGKTDDEAFDILNRNLHIVLITKEDAKHLDHDLKLQTVMPKGWVDGDTPFARFNAGEIPVILIK